MYLKNQFGFGEDCYPKSVDQCLLLLNQWGHMAPAPSNSPCTPWDAQTPPHDPKPDEALVFALSQAHPRNTFCKRLQGNLFQELQIIQCVGVPQITNV
jgi:hypothetical protein